MEIGVIYDSCGGLIGGQVTKTENVIKYFREQGYVLNLCDVHGLGRKKIFVLWKMLSAFCRENKKIILILSWNNYRYIIKILGLLNYRFKNQIYDLVIGGIRHTYLQKDRLACFFCKRTWKEYVETEVLRREYNAIGITKVTVLPSFLEYKQIEIRNMEFDFNEAIPLCTYSRVCKEKGVSEAICAVKKANQLNREILYRLDIYGPIEDQYREEFFALLEENASFASYKGVLCGDETYKILQNYFLLLFPTTHIGEGYPTAVLEAFMSGVPVIASDRNALPEIIKDNETGYIMQEPYVDNITELLIKLYEKPKHVLEMRRKCLEEAKKYDIYTVLDKLKEDIEEA